MDERYIIDIDMGDTSVTKIKANGSAKYLVLKRILDIIGSVFGIIILSPVFLIVSILIKLENPKGKVFFIQHRNGLNGRIFKMYKFRSMVENAEAQLDDLKDKNEMSGPAFKMKDDPRITRIGKFIRITSIDELPQLFNVLKGEMSLVGPRPPIPTEVECYNQYQMQRLMVKPGLTCYWQVGGRNDISFDEWVDLDIKYIKERNLLIDIKLILKTVLVLFGDKHAR